MVVEYARSRMRGRFPRHLLGCAAQFTSSRPKVQVTGDSLGVADVTPDGLGGWASWWSAWLFMLNIMGRHSLEEQVL
ncbi:hypothetical protein E2C01_022571 [Portunus trituberculatus]|uniref:Uncharacterized protein n=1 Tax=Portunus trituberculatus TaxID=210409 RepID=A0A5B7E895_PORTR|nr:hypothetical protein [Portunus trituberculatus]